MGCSGCGGVGYDPYAAYRHRSRGKYMGKGSSEGVIKSAKRLAKENKLTAKTKAEVAVKKEELESNPVSE